MPRSSALDLAAEQISACVESHYGLTAVRLDRLESGADPNASVYRLVSSRADSCFLKLIQGQMPEQLLAIPAWLASHRRIDVVAPMATRVSGELSVRLHDGTLVLYPYLEGKDGWTSTLSRRQWQSLGASLRALHESELPEELARGVPREAFSDHWRQRLFRFMDDACRPEPADPAAKGLAALLHTKRELIETLARRAGQLADAIERRAAVEQCLCHGDIHAGNILVTPGGQLYLVDWQTLIFAPRERDLMFIGGGVGGTWNAVHESRWFYEGYGDSPIDPELLAYYRCERIVQDIVVYCEELLMSDRGGDDRMKSLRQLAVQFEPKNVVEIAQATDAALPKR